VAFFGPIQLIPPGLLGALNIKNSGRNPQFLPDTYQSVLPMLDWLLLANQEVLQEGVAGIAASFSGFVAYPTKFIVPNDEWWYLHHISAQAGAAAAADTVQGLQPCMQIPGAVPTNIPLGAPTQATLTGTIANGFYSTARQIFVPPGTQLGVLMNKVTAAVSACTLAAQITRLPS
jgi:hypothetical protein